MDSPADIADKSDRFYTCTVEFTIYEVRNEVKAFHSNTNNTLEASNVIRLHPRHSIRSHFPTDAKVRASSSFLWSGYKQPNPVQAAIPIAFLILVDRFLQIDCCRAQEAQMCGGSSLDRNWDGATHCPGDGSGRVPDAKPSPPEAECSEYCIQTPLRSSYSLGPGFAKLRLGYVQEFELRHCGLLSELLGLPR